MDGDDFTSTPDRPPPERQHIVVLSDGRCPETVGALTRESDDAVIVPIDDEPRATAAASAGAVIVTRELGTAAGLLGRVADTNGIARLAVTGLAGDDMLSPLDALEPFDARSVVPIGSVPVVTLGPARRVPGTAASWVRRLQAAEQTVPPAATRAATVARTAPSARAARPGVPLRESGSGLVRRIGRRRSRLLGAIAVLAAGLATVLAIVSFGSPAAITFFILLGALQAASLAVMALVVARLRQTTRGLDAMNVVLRRLRQDVTAATGVVTTNAVASRELVRHLEADGTSTALDEQGRAMKEGFAALRQEVAQSQRSLLNDLQALQQLMAHYQPEAPLPGVAGWAMNPTGLMWLTDHIERTRPSLVVECGSGTSTLWMSLALRRAGGGRLVALEHLEEYAEATRQLIDRHGLSDLAEVRLAPLTTIATPRGSFSWYDVDADLDGIDLLLVDGPPGVTGKHARYPALHALDGRLAADATIVLDDSERADERDVLDFWLADDERLRPEGRVAPGVDVLRLLATSRAT